MKFTISEWCELKEIVILDSDGFDRTDSKLYERRFSEREFDKAIGSCTTIQRVYRNQELTPVVSGTIKL